MKLSHRERVYAAIRHQETDRVPIDFGGRISGIALSAYEDLKELLQFKARTEVLDMRLQLAKVDESILDRFQVDTRWVYQKAPASWDPKWDHEKDRFVDEWGITLAKPSKGFYYDYVKSPLAGAETVAQIENHVWPNTDDLSRNDGVVEEAEKLARANDPFFIGTSFKGPFEQSWALRGLEPFLMDLILDPELAEALLDRVLAVQKKLYGPFLELIAPYVDMVCFTDDMGGQLGPLISPKIYREIVKPRHIEMVKFIKEKTDGKIAALHCCGSVVDFLPDICEIGVEVLNPIQVTAAGMDIRVLKEKFGDKLTFWGAVDTQQLLPFGRPEAVGKAAARTREILGKNGGYLFAPVHNIQPLTPAANVLALFE